MVDKRWTVVKVGGSLFDLPDLGDRLRRFFATLGDAPTLIFPGGGRAADAVRWLDQIHQLGEEASHWLAIQALSINARFLQSLLPEALLIADAEECWRSLDRSSMCILDPWPFFQDDERRADRCPHAWDVTSDSLSLRAAALMGARALVLLKSVEWVGGDWSEAGQDGIVDAWFATALKKWPIAVKVVNLRA
ncbi:MAG: hypothetical protein FJ303_26510 [Planctomycetes bacterium]|nr:hypothetical protein [Planctomycetota bacterium]